MKLGLLTACLPDLSLDEVAAWASGAGYAALEVAVWPHELSRTHAASHIDVAGLDDAAAADIRRRLDERGLEISALAYYENNLHADPVERARINAHLTAVIDAASRLGVELVGTFVGRDITATVDENIRLAETTLSPLVERATRSGIRLVIENCPMEGWHPDGYPANLAYSPELWDWLTSLGLFLNFDPSHLVWLGIDPLEALTSHLDRVLHVQAKDIQVDRQARTMLSVFGRALDRGADPWSSGWWRYRIPGLGEVDWNKLVDRLYEGGFDGCISVEHEDPVWSGSPEKVKQGLVLAHRTLSPLLAD